MRKFLAILLAIITIITGFIAFIIFTSSYLTTEKNLEKMISKIEAYYIYKETNTSNLLGNFYQEVDLIGIDANQVISILKGETGQEYIKNILLLLVNNKLYNTPIETNKITDLTTQFINNLSDKNIIKINSEEKTILTNALSTSLTNNMIKFATTDGELEQILAEYVSFCQSSTTKIILLVVIFIEIATIILLRFKEKDFINYLGIIFIMISIEIMLFLGFINLTLNSTNTSISLMIKNLLEDTYYYSFILAIIIAIIGIISYVIHFRIKRHLALKQEVPF